MESANSLSKQVVDLNVNAKHGAGLSSTDSPISFENQIGDEKSWPSSVAVTPSRHVLVPAIFVCMPMVLLCVALLSIIFAFEVVPGVDIFEHTSAEHNYRQANYLLVDFSDTKIVFIASFLSTIAPTLAGCIMTLASISLIRRLCNKSSTDRSMSPAAVVQQNSLAGFSHDPYYSLLASLKQLTRRGGISQNKTVAYCAALMLLTVFMCLAVTASDATLHMLTKMITFTQYSGSSIPSVAHGRGISGFCTSFDRVAENYGFPCTTMVNSSLSDPIVSKYQAESQKLAHNTSASSEIRFCTSDDEDRKDLAYLIPRPNTILPDLDYRAKTLGVSAKCSLIPASTCNLTRWGPNNKAYTNFNCSNNFWGTLGLAENVSSINSFRKPSPYLPLLALKPQPNLEYSFFSDADLQTIYNPAGLNDSIYPDPNLKPTPDHNLPSTIYMAFAWRAAWNQFSGVQKNEIIAANQTGVYPGVYYVDYFVNCEITAYDVDYVWSNRTVRTVSSNRIDNGTVLNMWQATTPYRPSINGGGSNILQDINAQAAIAGTTISAYTNTFSQLLSQQVLATIGGYTSPRLVVQQQTRQTLLLAKVPKAALGALLASSLLYPVLGLFLLYKAYRSLRHVSIDNELASPGSDTLTVMPVSWGQRRHASISTQSHGSARWNEKGRVVDPVVRGHGDSHRHSTAGIRFVLFGDAGVGPSFNHLAPGSAL